jgi:hypothetical protein
MNRKLRLVALFVAIIFLVPTVSITASSTDESYVIIVAPQEQEAWQPVIDELLIYHPTATVLVLPPEIQSAVMDLDKQVKVLLMDGGLKVYLWYAYYVWGIRSIPVPWGYIYAGDHAQTNVILHLDRHKADVRDLFHDWFEEELGYQPHYIALVGDTKTRRSDWVGALGMDIWYDESLPYPADAWPQSMNAQQVPVAYLPFEVEECLAWYGYACGRITGDTIEDAIGLVERAGDYDEWVAANPEKASRFLSTFTVGVEPYYTQFPSLLTDAGYNYVYQSPDGPDPEDYPTWGNVYTELDEGVGIWQLTCHGNYMTGSGGPGNGLLTFLIPGAEDYYYTVPIGTESPAGGWSGEVWPFVNNNYLGSIQTRDIPPAMPSLDHTVVYVCSCMTGASEMPLQLVSEGAVAVIMGITSQEVCEGDCHSAYLFNALFHTNPGTGSQYSIGEAMAYAAVNTHVLHYYYAMWGGLTYWSSKYLIGDPALVPYCPNVGGYPEPLDPPGNNPGQYPRGSQGVLQVPMAIEAPDGSITILNVGKVKQKLGGDG